MGGPEEISLDRLQLLMEVAAKIIKIMRTSVWHLSLSEMKIILRLIQCGMEESMAHNDMVKEEE